MAGLGNVCVLCDYMLKVEISIAHHTTHSSINDMLARFAEGMQLMP